MYCYYYYCYYYFQFLEIGLVGHLIYFLFIYLFIYFMLLFTYFNFNFINSFDCIVEAKKTKKQKKTIYVVDVL